MELRTVTRTAGALLLPYSMPILNAVIGYHIAGAKKAIDKRNGSRLVGVSEAP
jgi:hypothetical protein